MVKYKNISILALLVVSFLSYTEGGRNRKLRRKEAAAAAAAASESAAASEPAAEEPGNEPQETIVKPSFQSKPDFPIGSIDQQPAAPSKPISSQTGSNPQAETYPSKQPVFAEKKKTKKKPKKCIEANDPLGLKYRGKKRTTDSGNTCVSWKNAKKGDLAQWLLLGLPRKIKAKTCLNPNSDDGGPWCFTHDSGNFVKESCPIQSCNDDGEDDSSPTPEYDLSTCYSDDIGLNYQGILPVTESGAVCHNWSTLVYPYGSGKEGKMFKKDRKKLRKHNHNKCMNINVRRTRNGDAEYATRPWCFSNSNQHIWEYCDIPKCGAEGENNGGGGGDSNSSEEPATMPQCGIRQTNIDRIVNGENTGSNEFPWQIHMRLSGNSMFAGFGYCGGSILNANWILTAAHCVVKQESSFSNAIYTIEYMSIAVGWHKAGGLEQALSEAEKNLGSDIIPVKRFIPHASYRTSTLHYDIALVELTRPIQWPVGPDTNVRPACLPTAAYEAEMDTLRQAGEKCIVTGWGTTEKNPDADRNFLIMGAVPVISNDECHSLVDGVGFGSLYEHNVCAMHDGDHVDSCQGDSGGPLVCQHPNDVFYAQVGITSWGYNCGDIYPGVYSKVSGFIDWILSETGATDLQVVDVSV